MSFENIYEDMNKSDLVAQYNEIRPKMPSANKTIEAIEDRHGCVMPDSLSQNIIKTAQNPIDQA